MSPRRLSSPRRNYTFNPFFPEFVATTHEIVEEVLDVTSGTRDLDSSDELLVSTVDALMTLLEIVGYDSDFDELMTMFHPGPVHMCSSFDPNPSLRNRILRAITGMIKLRTFIVQQPEMHTGDIDAIAQRFLNSIDPDVPEAQRFDITDVIPARGVAHLIQQITGPFDLPESTGHHSSSSAQNSDTVDPFDQIPLD